MLKSQMSNGYFELPDGQIGYVCGMNKSENVVRYYLDDDVGVRCATFKAYFKWTIRRDLKDFPNARDPMLPYEFDLLFNIKRKSELENKIKELQSVALDLDDLKRMIKYYKINMEVLDENL